VPHPDAASLADADARTDAHTAGRHAETGTHTDPDATRPAPAVTDRPAVGAIVGSVDASGRVLFVKQTGGPFKGTWVLPGGRVELGEAVEDAARRELLEESGLVVGELRPVALYDVRSARHRFHILLTMFRGDAVTGAPQPERDSELRWAPPEDLDLHPVVAVELVDLGVLMRSPEALRAALATIDVEMRRLF
jgi:8-oxo-dGTP diphosphatase